MVIKLLRDKKVCSFIPAAILPRDSRRMGLRGAGSPGRKLSCPGLLPGRSLGPGGELATAQKSPGKSGIFEMLDERALASVSPKGLQSGKPI